MVAPLLPTQLLVQALVADSVALLIVVAVPTLSSAMPQATPELARTRFLDALVVDFLVT